MSEPSLIKFQVLRTPTLSKRYSSTGFSSEICEIFKNTLCYRTFPTAASDSFKFPARNFTVKETPERCISVNFAKFLRTSFDRVPPNDCFLCLYVNFEKFFRISFWEHLWQTVYFMNKFQNFNHKVQQKTILQVLLFQAFYTRAKSSHLKMFVYLKSLKVICEEVNL